MALILNIETATPVCSVCLSRDGKVLVEKRNLEQNSHSQVLTVYIQEIFEEQKISVENLDAVAVSMGPGSYTGLRIGLSVAKGLCYSASIPLIGVSTLQAMAWGMADLKKDKNALFCPMIDARRMEVYAAFYNSENSIEREIRADIIDEDSYKTFLENGVLYFAGDGAEKCKESLYHSNAHFLDQFSVSSKFLVAIAEEKFSKNDFEDTAYCEPFYLKQFQAGKPKVKGLR